MSQEPSQYKPQDPHFDELQAISEGWSIFDCEGSENGRWQICRIDDAASAQADGLGPVPQLSSDDIAWAIVVEKAAGGSAYHRSALTFIKQHNPIEFTSICKTHPVVGAMTLDAP